VVMADAESVGVSMAMLEKGVQVPGDLRVAFHKNAEVDLFCPFPVTHIVSKVDDAAGVLLDNVQRQFAGAKVAPVVLKYTVQESAGQVGKSGTVLTGANSRKGKV
jgi:hypothetical protein